MFNVPGAMDAGREYLEFIDTFAFSALCLALSITNSITG